MRALVDRADLSRRVEVDSAGTGAWHAGEPADARAQRTARQRGYELPSVARRFEQTDFDRFHYVLAMDRSNLRDLQAMARTPEQRAKIHLFRAFDPAAPPGAEVPDPYYGGPRGFDDVLDICEAACQGLLDHLRGELEG